MIGLLALGIALQPVPGAPGASARPGGWVVVDELGTCSATTVQAGNVRLWVSYDSGTDVATLMVASPALERLEAGRVYPIVIEFSNGRLYPATQARAGRADGATGRLTNVSLRLGGSAFLDDLASAAGAGLFIDDVRLELLPLRETGAMVTRLRRCAVASHHRYPDPFARLPRRPIVPPQADEAGGPSGPGGPRRTRANLSSYFSADDYPAAALRENGMGDVGFSLTIGANGRVEDCLVTASSGSPALDQATCRILRARARYIPARDANGNPAQGQDAGRVTWRVPAD
jgi:TonB family protein